MESMEGWNVDGNWVMPMTSSSFAALAGRASPASTSSRSKESARRMGNLSAG